jgi:sugar-specific transcriptional regulator TrmB
LNRLELLNPGPDSSSVETLSFVDATKKFPKERGNSPSDHLAQLQEDGRNGEELIEKLSEFGLSYDEATIFYLLVRIRKSGLDWISGKEIAQIAKRDRVRVYQVLQKLQKLGVIRANFERPTGYSAMPIEAAIERLVSIHEAKLHQLNIDQHKLKEDLKNADPIVHVGRKIGGEEQNKATMSMFHGVSGIQHLIRNSIVGNSVKIIANPDSIDYILSTIERSPEKPVSCKVLVSSSEKDAPDLPGTNNSLELAYISGHFPTFILTGNLVLILFYTVENYKPKPLSPKKSRFVMLHALSVSDKVYVEEMHQLFETLWQMSSRTKPFVAVESED